jgi:hypothetical protein
MTDALTFEENTSHRNLVLSIIAKLFIDQLLAQNL